jgi:hypothetical protein
VLAPSICPPVRLDGSGASIVLGGSGDVLARWPWLDAPFLGGLLCAQVGAGTVQWPVISVGL